MSLYMLSPAFYYAFLLSLKSHPQISEAKEKTTLRWLYSLIVARDKAIKANDAVLMTLQIVNYPRWITIAWENRVMNRFDDAIIRDECDTL